MLRIAMVIAPLALIVACDTATDAESPFDANGQRLQLGESLADHVAQSGDEVPIPADEALMDALDEMIGDEPCLTGRDVVGWVEGPNLTIDIVNGPSEVVPAVTATVADYDLDGMAQLFGRLAGAPDQTGLVGEAGPIDKGDLGIGTWTAGNGTATLVGVWGPVDDGISILVGVEIDCAQ